MSKLLAPVTARGSRSLDRAAQCRGPHPPGSCPLQWPHSVGDMSPAVTVTHHTEHSDRETGNLMDIDYDLEVFGECLCWDT